MKLIVIDLETTYETKSPAVGVPAYSLSQMSTADYIQDQRFHITGFAFKVDDKPTRWVPEDKVDATLTMLKPHIASRVMVCHNSHFDAGILAWRYGIHAKMNLCTMMMSRATGHNVHAGGASLAKMSAYYDLGTKAPIHPNMTQEETEARATIDTDITAKLFQILLPKFNLDELKAIDWTVRIWTQPRILANRARLERIIVDHDKVVAAALAKTGYEIEDMRSPGRFADALIKLGIDPPMKPSPTTGDETWAFAKTDEGFVELLESEDDDVAALAEARLGSKAGGDADRAERLLRMSAFGPLPVFLNYGHNFTLRWAGGDKTNWMNFKRGGEIRKSLEPHPECEFGVGDLAQIEARITAWLCGCTPMLDAFADPARDLYCEFGTDAFRRVVTKADEYERFSSKGVVLGSGFGAGGRTIAKQMQAEVRKRRLTFTPPDEVTCDGLVGFYRSQYREVVEGWDTLMGFIRTPGSEFGPCLSVPGGVRLPNGLMLHYPGLSFDRWENKQREQEQGWRYDGRKGRTKIWGGKAMENHASSLAKCLITWQLVRLDADLCALGGGVVSMTHDEVITMNPVIHHDTVKGLMNRWLTMAPAWAAGLPLACEVKFGDTYGDLQK